MEIVPEELIKLQEKYKEDDLSKLIRGIDFIVYGVRQGERVKTVCELLYHRPYVMVENYHAGDEIISVLKMDEHDPVLLIVEGANEHAGINDMVQKFGPRIISIGFAVHDIETVFEIIQSRGIHFTTDSIQERNNTRYIATTQSTVTLDSYYYIERKHTTRTFDFIQHAEPMEIEEEILEALKKKKRLKVFKMMNGLDHIAYRVHHYDIIQVAKELMMLTPYRYTEAFEIEEHDAKTVVFRSGDRKLAIVASYGRNDESLVEQYVIKFGPRVHHIAYEVTDIFKVTSLQKKRGMTFTSDDVIGTREEGIVQIFTTPSNHTNEITEYIQRFDGFTGFFSNKNVGNLMTSTRAFQ